MYYDINKTLSKQRIFNFVIGPRGVGKTYSAKKRVIDTFVKNGGQFVYIRRYDTELPAAEMRNFFDDVSLLFPGVEFKSSRGLFHINKEVAGWYIPLSKATMLKSVPFPNVKLIIFDEFIIEVGSHRYLPNEVRTFLECYSTVSRDRDIPVVFLSNAITLTNPYFIYFNIELGGSNKLLTQDISVELVDSPVFVDHMNKTRFGRLVRDTPYGKYSIENKFLLDTDIFVEKLPGGCNYISTLILDGNSFGVYNKLNGLVYISENVDETFRYKIALSTADHSDETVLLLRGNYMFTVIIDAYCSGKLRFTTTKAKNMLIPFLRKSI
ncbi:MAG: DNA encapsidation protein [Podoviridae sp. ctbd591]|nr:MAG: DNA encapsidation protein [Podoviridae sp. ctbd591]